MRFIIVAIMLSFINPSFSEDGCVTCGTGVRGMAGVDKTLEMIAKTTKEDEVRIKKLSIGICDLIRETGDLNEFPNKMEEYLIFHMEKYTKGFSRNDSNRNAKMVKYLNANKDDIKCKNTADQERNYMVSAIEKSVDTALFFKFFLVKLNNPDVQIDINTTTNGETTLDFIDDFINDTESQFTISKLCRIRKVYTDKYGAVNSGNIVNEVGKCTELFAKR